MASPSVRTNLVRFPRERSTSLNFVDHDEARGVTTIGFMDQKTGLPKCDYDYEDPEMALYLPLISAERPGSAFRQLMKDRKVPQYIAKRAAEGAPEPAAKAAAPRAAKTVSGIVEMPTPETTITVKSGMPAAPSLDVIVPANLAPEQIPATAGDVSSRIEGLQVVDAASNQRMVELLQANKRLQDAAETHHRPIISAAYATWKAGLAALASIIDPLVKAEKIGKQRMVDWREAEERKAAEIARQQREEAARQQREAERQQREEYERQLAEARAREEEARRLREAELEATLEAAEANEASPVEIAAIMAQANEEMPMPAFVPPPPPPTPIMAARVPAMAPPKAAGSSVKTAYVGVIQNKAALLKFIAENVKQYEDLVEIKQGSLDKLGNGTNGKLVLPGVQWATKSSVSIRK